MKGVSQTPNMQEKNVGAMEILTIQPSRQQKKQEFAVGRTTRH